MKFVISSEEKYRFAMVSCYKAGRVLASIRAQQHTAKESSGNLHVISYMNAPWLREKPSSFAIVA